MAPVYATAKSGVIHFTRSIAPRLRKRNIRICALCPQQVDTPLVSCACQRRVNLSPKVECLLVICVGVMQSWYTPVSSVTATCVQLVLPERIATCAFQQSQPQLEQVDRCAAALQPQLCCLYR